MRLLRAAVAGVAFLFLTACASTSQHKFTAPSDEWRTRVGQMRYQSGKTSFIGDVLARTSSNGNFELTFSKGPGMTLLLVQQDPDFVRISGPLARGSWSGSPKNAPVHLRGWLSLRDEIANVPSGKTVRKTIGGETFVFRF